MEVELDVTKSVPENAAHYYEQSKKAKKKLEGLRKAIKETKKELEHRKEKAEEEKAKSKRKKKRERDWYEKYHWFFTSDGLLVIAGKDVKTNTEIVKKRMQDTDMYFHADIHGAPSTVVQSEGKKIPKKSREEAAQFAGTYSKAFSAGIEVVDIYCVAPDQVKTSAKSGEYLPKGGFVILGEREWFRKMPLRVAVSYDSEKQRAFAGPPSSIKSKAVVVAPGRESKGMLAKKIKAFLDRAFDADVPLDELIQLLPTGGGRIAK